MDSANSTITQMAVVRLKGSQNQTKSHESGDVKRTWVNRNEKEKKRREENKCCQRVSKMEQYEWNTSMEALLGGPFPCEASRGKCSSNSCFDYNLTVDTKRSCTQFLDAQNCEIKLF